MRSARCWRRMKRKQLQRLAAAALRYNSHLRGVAQPGSVPAWGAGGRRFKSSRPDQNNQVVISAAEPGASGLFRYRYTFDAVRLLLERFTSCALPCCKPGTTSTPLHRTTRQGGIAGCIAAGDEHSTISLVSPLDSYKCQVSRMLSVRRGYEFAAIEFHRA